MCEMGDYKMSTSTSTPTPNALILSRRPYIPLFSQEVARQRAAEHSAIMARRADKLLQFKYECINESSCCDFYTNSFEEYDAHMKAHEFRCMAPAIDYVQWPSTVATTSETETKSEPEQVSDAAVV